MTARDLIRLAERDGWSVSITNGGHLRLEHPDATGPVFTGSTPSDQRALANTLAMMRRTLPKDPKPVVERRCLPKRKPKRQPKPKPTRTKGAAAVELYVPPERPRRPQPGAPAGYVTTRWPVVIAFRVLPSTPPYAVGQVPIVRQRRLCQNIHHKPCKGIV